MNIKEETLKMKQAAPVLASSSNETRIAALKRISEALSKNRKEIFAVNKEDVSKAETDGVSAAVIKRLKFTEEKLADALAGIEQLCALPDPSGMVQIHRELDENLIMKRVTCPIGVIGVIFEARPDALIQISCLCLRSGNAAVLKGGKETAGTNRILFKIIHEAAVQAGLPEECLLQAEAHSEVDELLSCSGTVDLLIPRGSNSFVKYIMDHTNIPVLGHADGVCHIYIDKAANREMVLPVLLDAKLQYTAACNAVETILINNSCKDMLTELAPELHKNGIRLRGTAEEKALIPEDIPFEIMDEEDYHTEYLEPVLSLKLVNDTAEAVSHINRFGSHHTDAILTEDDEAAEFFFGMVDSAGVYRNCSTRFADGFRYGFGAEVGISTSKIHARGPVGLEGLMTYKYIIEGNGHTVGDYAAGKKVFTHRDL